VGNNRTKIDTSFVGAIALVTDLAGASDFREVLTSLVGAIDSLGVHSEKGLLSSAMGETPDLLGYQTAPLELRFEAFSANFLLDPHAKPVRSTAAAAIKMSPISIPLESSAGCLGQQSIMLRTLVHWN
jgi:hypothetical protein